MPIDFNSARRVASVRTTVDEGLRAYVRAVYAFMAGGLALTGAVAWFGYSSGLYQLMAAAPLLFYAVMFSPLILVLVLNFRIQRMSLTGAQLTYWAYAALMGLSLAGIFMFYTGQSIARVFFITAGTFGGMSVWGYTTRKDLSGWGSFLFMGLIGVIIAGVVNIFLHSSAVQFAVSVMGVIVFVGLTAYDTQRIKQLYYAADSRDTLGKTVVLGALRLYLDFINLFLSLLQLFGGRRN